MSISRPTVPVAALLTLCCLLAPPTAALGAAPTITDTHVSDPTTTSITLNASIDPQGKGTKYHFEYGPADCAANPCTSIPEANLPATVTGSADLTSGSALVSNLLTTTGAFTVGQEIQGTGIPASTTILSRTATELKLSNSATATAHVALTATGPQSVAQHLEGLPPGSLYHYRLLAKNSEGEVKGPDRLFATYAPPPTFGPCPNEAFRSGELSPPAHPSANLPDCRAYEQASPVDKDGNDARGSEQRVRAAPDGSAITFGVSSGVPGGDGAQHHPLYLASRSAGLWSTQGLNPPATLGPEGWPLGWTPDFATTFSFADLSVAAAVDDLTLIARDTATGAITTIVPYGSGMRNVSLAATSPDGSLALFESRGGIATIPGALPGKTNLYLWQRATNTLTLAGLLNDGTTPPGGAELGALATGNPTYRRDNNAVAADGSYVFTAKGSGEIYMRRNPTQPQSAVVVNGAGKRECTEPAKACTLELSATEKDNGKGTGGSDAAGHQPANFMTATPDGSRVFFTSSEKLTDDATTGPEPDKQAAIARADLADGNGESFEFLPTHAKGIAISGSHIYWADPTTNSIGRAKLGAGGPEDPEPAFISVPEVDVEPGVSAPARPQYVAIDPAAEYVYWTNAPDEEDGHGSIGRAKLEATEAVAIDPEYIQGKEAGGEEKLQATNPQGIAVNTDFIYWANAGESDATRTIGRARSGMVIGEEVNGEFIPVGEGGLEHRPQGIAINTTHIYMVADSGANEEFSSVRRFDLDGDTVSLKILFDIQHDGKAGDRGIALDATHVYWAREGEDSIGRAPLDLSSKELEWIKTAGNPRGIALDATHVYWAANQQVEPNPGNDLYRFDREAPAGQRLTDLVPDAVDPNGSDVRGVLGASADGSYVYYAAAGVPDGPIANSPNQNGEEAEPLACTLATSSRCNLYLSHGGTTTFIAQLEVGPGNDDDDDNLLTAPAPSDTARPPALAPTDGFSSSPPFAGLPPTTTASTAPTATRPGQGLACSTVSTPTSARSSASPATRPVLRLSAIPASAASASASPRPKSQSRP